MFPLVLASLYLLLFSQAWQIPFVFEFSTNSCRITENDNSIRQTHLNSAWRSDCLSSDNHLLIEAPKPSSPWTRETRCVDDDNMFHKFCVYTDGKFANGRGISLFTEPRIAESIAALPAFKQEGVHGEQILWEERPWEIRSVPGRGNGLFAKKVFQRGAEILTATPVGVFQSIALSRDFQLGYPCIHRAYKQLSEATRMLVDDMAAHNVGDFLLERINTNAFAVNFEDQHHLLLYPETALMNHDCRPKYVDVLVQQIVQLNNIFSAISYFDPQTFIYSTRALRIIEPGDEITSTYINLLQYHSDRQENLQSTWGFKCTCSLCTAPSINNRISDARIRQILELQAQLSNSYSKSIDPPALAEKLLTLYEQEGLHAAIGLGHMLTALAYNAVGNWSTARSNARKALDLGLVKADEWGLVAAGNMGKMEEDMYALLADTKRHWSYKARRVLQPEMISDDDKY